MFIARQRLGKEVPAEKNTQATKRELPFLCNGEVNTPATIGVLLETVFSIQSIQSGYKEELR
jgi:hypothetical protein